MRHLDSDALAAFVAVFDFGSFTAAAESLGKTQAAVSLAIARLEQRLGKRLLDRSRGGVRPTAAGEQLIVHARHIQEIEAEALRALTDRATEARVRLGMPDDFIPFFGDGLIHRFSPAHREINIDLLCDFSRQLVVMIEACDLDVAVIVQNPEAPRGEVFRHEPQVWCTGPNGTPEKDEVLPLALFSHECSARPRIVATLERAGRPWRLVYSASHVTGVQLAAATGNLVTVLPASAVPQGWRRLGPADGLPELPDLSLALLTSRSDRRPARQVAAFLRTEYGQPDLSVPGGDRRSPGLAADTATATA